MNSLEFGEFCSTYSFIRSFLCSNKIEEYFHHICCLCILHTIDCISSSYSLWVSMENTCMSFDSILYCFQIFLSIISGLDIIRGIFIFFIFIWKRSVWKMIVKRHPRLAKALEDTISCCRRRIQQHRLNNTEFEFPLILIH